MSIRRRTWFADTRNNRIRFLDFCLVDTTIGPGVEFRQLNEIPEPKSATGDTMAREDPNDELRFVSDINTGVMTSEDCLIFNGLHGGWQFPRDFRYPS
uniref:Uncharacterized protein n=1 Tax=viral metagenome TaxID=1070528 RepID=A0A6M3L5V8_9ZZZZ